MLAFRQQYNGFHLDDNFASVVDPALGIIVIALSLEVVRRVLLRHYTWKVNEKAFEPKLEQSASHTPSMRA